MSGTFSVEWLPGGVLMQRRTGVLSADQANDYVAAVKRAVEVAPARWGCVVDTRDAVAQATDVQEIIQELIKHVTARGVLRVALVSTRATTEIQQQRVTTAPGMHDPSTVSTHRDLEAAIADVRAAVLTFGLLTWFWQEGHGSNALFGIPATGCDHLLDSADGVRVPVRVVDGLRGVHPQPDARGVRRNR
jgi:hypothetical protein